MLLKNSVNQEHFVVMIETRCTCICIETFHTELRNEKMTNAVSGILRKKLSSLDIKFIVDSKLSLDEIT